MRAERLAAFMASAAADMAAIGRKIRAASQ
jgi:hypothetical protein